MRILISIICLTLFSVNVTAAKPDWAGSDKSREKHQTIEKKGKYKHAGNGSERRYFSEHDHQLIRAFFGGDERNSQGKVPKKQKSLPPGLVKKSDRGGELPPGWQRKLARGEVVDAKLYLSAHSVPSSLLDRLPIDQRTEEIIRIQDKVIRMTRGDGTIIDVIDIADVMVGRGMRE